ncbi:MAG TPA: O-antigen ligase family protein [Chitinophagaceae bacterium]|nr:O-antigen ligase family protein [Chitinophagaceae bacterium]
MNSPLKNKLLFTQVITLLYILFFSSLVFSFRAVSSISIGLLFIAGLILNRKELKARLGASTRIFLFACSLFFLLQVFSLLWTRDLEEGWKNVSLNSGMLLIPLAVLFSHHQDPESFRKLFGYYCLILVAASVFCLFHASLFLINTNDSSHFFYHSLVKPLKQHAVYFSIYVIIGLFHLLDNMERKQFLIARSIHIMIFLYLSIFLFLLSSKLIIILYLILILSYFIKYILKSSGKGSGFTGKRVFTVLSVLLIITITSYFFLTPNPVSNRFYEIAHGGLDLVSQDQFTPGHYFNGLQFRLLQWKWVPSILFENNAWVLGVSPGDAQFMLDQTYVSKHMYTGDLSRGDHGYLGYNTHNQYLQTLLQNGILGLTILVFLYMCLVRLAFQSRNWIAVIITLLVFIYGFSESILETQYGMLLFLFFPLYYSLVPPGEPVPAGKLIRKLANPFRARA